jgi:hypothetical protein
MEKTKDIQQGRAKSRSRNKRKWLKLKHGTISQSRSYILLRAIPHTSPSMWATRSPHHHFLRQAIHKMHGPHYHHHPWLQSCLTINRQKGIARHSSVICVKNLKLEQSTTLCQSQDTFTKAIQGLNQIFSMFNVIFALLIFMFFLKTI